MGEGVNQPAVAQFARVFGRDAVDKLAPFGALPVFTTYFGPRTAAAGFIGTTWPITSQSSSMRTAAAGCCFTPGAPSVFCSFLHPGRHVEWPDHGECQSAPLAPGKEPSARPDIYPAGVGVVDVGGEELNVAPAGVVAFLVMSAATM
jgi:hypothetical protein